MNAEQKQRAVDLIDVTKTYRLDAEECAMQMAALLQELVDAPGAEPVARVTGYYAGYLSIATVDGRVLPTGTALYTAPPAPSVPDMPLSMEQFGGLVGLARDDASEKAIVYKATNIYGETCYFGVKSTAQAWAKSGRVDEVRLRELRVVATPPTPSVPDGWLRAIDEAMVVHHIGIADRADGYEEAKKKLNELLAINSDIARYCSEPPADVARDAERYRACNGSNCGCTDGISHSDECISEHDSIVNSAAQSDHVEHGGWKCYFCGYDGQDNQRYNQFCARCKRHR